MSTKICNPFFCVPNDCKETSPSIRTLSFIWKSLNSTCHKFNMIIYHFFGRPLPLESDSWPPSAIWRPTTAHCFKLTIPSCWITYLQLVPRWKSSWSPNKKLVAIWSVMVNCEHNEKKTGLCCNFFGALAKTYSQLSKRFTKFHQIPETTAVLKGGFP